ncbi:hypothetical protein BDN71DRAFT_1513683 [Pleurotus eryngii]|uniref:Uncharacterized protein n=1 Tax=Pleurotus eryngii TaxID=5323 RepID=A0A9P6D8K5_PLEER|nr:hypothetical protein BDN71DRAFT_1513683 [Pleurotus eryngii]
MLASPLKLLNNTSKKQFICQNDEFQCINKALYDQVQVDHIQLHLSNLENDHLRQLLFKPQLKHINDTSDACHRTSDKQLKHLAEVEKEAEDKECEKAEWQHTHERKQQKKKQRDAEKAVEKQVKEQWQQAAVEQKELDILLAKEVKGGTACFNGEEFNLADINDNANTDTPPPPPPIPPPASHPQPCLQPRPLARPLALTPIPDKPQETANPPCPPTPPPLNTAGSLFPMITGTTQQPAPKHRKHTWPTQAHMHINNQANPPPITVSLPAPAETSSAASGTSTGPLEM